MLTNNDSLASHGISLDMGNPKNVNKNPVAEKANQELEKELLKVEPTGNPISAVVLLQAVCLLNSRIRSCGLSSREMFLGRDQVTGSHLKFSDKQISEFQESTRAKNHDYSSKCKARGAPPAKRSSLVVGSLVYLKDDGDKFNPRVPYIIVKIKSDNVLVQKSSPSGLLSSKQYWLPNEKVFPVIPLKEMQKKEEIGPPVQSSDSSDSDSCDSLDSRNEYNQPNVVSEALPSEQSAGSSSHTGRPSRSRSKPQRYGIDQDNNQFTDDTHDLIPSWYPGWDQEKTRNYITRNNDS